MGDFMSLWNVFKMEIYKNATDKGYMTVIAVLAVLNILGSIAVRSTFGALAIVFPFAYLGTIVFVVVYPFQMARADYKNKVMSLLIASGMSRIHYYFVKVGATLLFSFFSFFVLIIVPIIFLDPGSITAIVTDLVLDAGFLLHLIVVYLSVFSVMMTSIIIAKGRVIAGLIMFGIYMAISIISALMYGPLAASFMWIPGVGSLVQSLIITSVMALIGILVLRKQDL